MDHLGHGLALDHPIFSTPHRPEFDYVEKERPKHYEGATSPLWPDGVPDTMTSPGNSVITSPRMSWLVLSPKKRRSSTRTLTWRPRASCKAHLAPPDNGAPRPAYSAIEQMEKP